MTAWSHVLHHSLSVVTNVEYNAYSALPVAISLSWKVNKMLSYRGCAILEAQCFQLIFLFGHIKLWLPLPAAALFTHFSIWILFVLQFSPSQSRKMTSWDCLLPDHSSFNWTLKSWSRCWKLYSPFGLIHWMPAFSWGMTTGGELILWLKILDWLIFTVLQTWVWRFHKLTLNLVELEVVALRLGELV